MSETTHPQPNGTLAGAAGSEQPIRPGTAMRELGRPECLRLLAATSIGRGVVSVPEWDPRCFDPSTTALTSLPSPCCFARHRDPSCTPSCARRGRRLRSIASITRGGLGWSVIDTGVCEEITANGELRRVEALGLEPRVPGTKGHRIRIRPNVVSGRRIVTAAPAVPTYHV
jgi:uncharacterized protein